jgi:hypothetical protein
MKNINENELRNYIIKKLEESYFDDMEFDNDAMKAAMSDIEASGEEFEELGASKFEKSPKFAEKFKSDLNRANLELPSDEEEVERLAQMVKSRNDHESRFGKGSLNETEIDHIKDANGKPIKLKSPVQHESGVNGVVERFMVGDDKNMLVKVAWIQSPNVDKLNPVVSPEKLIVKENMMEMNEEAFASKANRRLMLIAMFGAIVGQGVVWHTGQFYAQIFINKILQVDFITTNLIIAASLVVGTPLFVYFGSLSDRVGRKKIMLGGMALAALGYYPLFSWMSTIVAQEGTMTNGAIFLTWTGKLELAFICSLLVTFAAMAYGPIAAFLVELFPTKIRYTSLSIPYHFANGVFGGCAPFVATWLGAVTHSNFAGLFYPIALAALTVIIGMIYLPETKGRALSD